MNHLSSRTKIAASLAAVGLFVTGCSSPMANEGEQEVVAQEDTEAESTEIVELDDDEDYGYSTYDDYDTYDDEVMYGDDMYAETTSSSSGSDDDEFTVSTGEGVEAITGDDLLEGVPEAPTPQSDGSSYDTDDDYADVSYGDDVYADDMGVDPGYAPSDGDNDIYGASDAVSEQVSETTTHLKAHDARAIIAMVNRAGNMKMESDQQRFTRNNTCRVVLDELGPEGGAISEESKRIPAEHFVVKRVKNPVRTGDTASMDMLISYQSSDSVWEQQTFKWENNRWKFCGNAL